MSRFESWEGEPDRCGQEYILDDKRHKLAQVFWFKKHQSAEVRGLDKNGAGHEAMQELHRRLINKLRSHGVTYAWSTCPYELGLHHERTYGWGIIGAPDFNNDVQIEYWIPKEE